MTEITSAVERSERITHTYECLPPHCNEIPGETAHLKHAPSPALDAPTSGQDGTAARALSICANVGIYGGSSSLIPKGVMIEWGPRDWEQGTGDNDDQGVILYTRVSLLTHL